MTVRTTAGPRLPEDFLQPNQFAVYTTQAAFLVDLYAANALAFGSGVPIAELASCVLVSFIDDQAYRRPKRRCTQLNE